MKFKVGDRVKIIRKSFGHSHSIGEIGEIVEIRERPRVLVDDLKQWVDYVDIQKVGASRPKKEKPIKFIAIYDETDGDLHETFTSRKDLMKWAKEAKEDKNIVFDSIDVYPVGKKMKVEIKTRFSLKGGE